MTKLIAMIAIVAVGAFAMAADKAAAPAKEGTVMAKKEAKKATKKKAAKKEAAPAPGGDANAPK